MSHSAELLDALLLSCSFVLFYLFGAASVLFTQSHYGRLICRWLLHATHVTASSSIHEAEEAVPSSGTCSNEVVFPLPTDYLDMIINSLSLSSPIACV